MQQKQNKKKKTKNNLKYLIQNIPSITFLPFYEIIYYIMKILDEESNLKIIFDKKKIIKFLDKSEDLVIFTIILYYILLIILEILLTLNILQGSIPNYNFLSLTLITIITISITIFLVNKINKRIKSKNFSILIYIQILILLPLISAYWIASIEGKDIILKNINADQWCNIFNSIIIYVSGCIIGFSNYLKPEK